MSETNLEYLITNAYKTDLIKHIESHPEDFNELIELALGNKTKYAWRAAWLLWSCIKENDSSITMHLDSIVTSLPEKPDNSQREFLILLQKMDIPLQLQAILFDNCINIWKQIDKQASLRFNAFKLLVILVQLQPELSSELHLYTSELYTQKLSKTAKKSISRLLQSR